MKTAVLAIALLTGCASLPPGVTMEDADRVACEQSQDCTVWTMEELRRLVGQAMQRGYLAGRQSL